MSATILHVEDSADDALLVSLALKRQEFPASIYHVSDGQEALDYLEGSGVYSDRQKYPWPTVVLLDLQLRKLDGFDVLSRRKKNDKAQPQVPIIVLSSSIFQSDNARAFELGAADFLTKEFDFPELGSRLQRAVKEQCGRPDR